MTNCTQVTMEFPRCQRRVVEASFEGGAITSDGGALLLRQVDRYLGLSAAVARALPDPRSCARMPGYRRRWIGIRRWPAARPCAGGRTGRTGPRPGRCTR